MALCSLCLSFNYFVFAHKDTALFFHPTATNIPCKLNQHFTFRNAGETQLHAPKQLVHVHPAIVVLQLIIVNTYTHNHTIYVLNLLYGYIAGSYLSGLQCNPVHVWHKEIYLQWFIHPGKHTQICSLAAGWCWQDTLHFCLIVFFRDQHSVMLKRPHAGGPLPGYGASTSSTHPNCCPHSAT